jgi:hypothetical protein
MYSREQLMKLEAGDETVSGVLRGVSSLTLIQLTPLPPLVPEYEDFRRWFVEINVAPPPVGSRVTAYGFAESKIEPDSDPDSFVCIRVADLKNLVSF